MKDSQPNEIIKFSCQKNVIQQMVDPRYIIKFKMDEFVTDDKTLRFYATDQNNDESVALKLYFKGNPNICKFQNMEEEPEFRESIDDCHAYQILNNRLYNLPEDNDQPIPRGTKPIFRDVLLPQCISPQASMAGRTNYLNAFTLPEGISIKELCMHELDLSNYNSCLPFIKIISKGLLHAIQLFNSSTRFFKHSNILPENIFLFMRRGHPQVFLDNMFKDNIKYDDPTAKPFKTDFNMMANLLIGILLGTDDVKLREPLINTYDLYMQLDQYIKKHNININLKSLNLGVPAEFMRDRKCQTVRELNYKLKNSFFNLIYRLKCLGTRDEEQFMEISQALNHPFINPPMETKKKVGWNFAPADY